MSEQAQTEQSCGEHGGGVPWYPLRKWWQSSRLFNQDVGLPPFLEPGDPRWMDVGRLQGSLAACSSWPGYIAAPLFVPSISGSTRHPGQEISKEQYKWRVSLDVAHFSPQEISLSVRDGFLEVGGKHEERPDEHGFIARCFTRKYRLPAEVDATKIVSTLSVDGILTVEAPVPETSVPAAVIIPIKVELEAAGEKKEDDEAPDTTPDSPSAGDDGEESPLEVHGDQAGPATAGRQQHEERRELEEETHEEPAGESHPSVAADGEGTEGLEDPSKHSEPLESQESPDTDTSKQPEPKEPAGEGEIQVTAGSGEAAEETTQPEEPELGESPASEVPSQELEAPSIKQEHTE